MYLLDSNFFLELLLDQDKADAVERFLRTRPREELHISEFSLYSVGIVLFRRRQSETFVAFLNDLVATGGVGLLRLSVEDMAELAVVAQRFNLDFDDAYQYVVAEKHGLEIISFDAGRNVPRKTRAGRGVPACRQAGRGTILKMLHCREAPACGRRASLRSDLRKVAGHPTIFEAVPCSQRSVFHLGAHNLLFWRKGGKFWEC